ncbi:hypothetical protein BDY19DRAFT_12250 [Irpex rosettiformis]|uniref:Uncharacterized protein n=1 Tax=Irpex rosettiformis TaxID=378272 RepID=A0ACB8UIN6_9APHY|nr:hypothetical protein BDY19DRAFT_12250 [Irpex rosettiformis]
MSMLRRADFPYDPPGVLCRGGTIRPQGWFPSPAVGYMRTYIIPCRLDLGTVLTKLHVFRLTQYSKIIFLDADVLPIRPISHLFTLPHEFSAVPDVGWPDIFNSGVLVLSPGQDKFDELTKLQKTKGSWDGGDQGLLNEWRGSNWNRLSFVYNTTPTAAYTYAPAYERFGAGISAVHFIGENKPWKGLLYRSPGIKTSESSFASETKRIYNYEALVDRWYDVYDKHYRQEPTLSLPDFSIPKYSSAWDDSGSIGAELPTASSWPSLGFGPALGLDDLRKAAVEGLNTFSRPSSGSLSLGSSVGEYLSMPLEGRVDLMRPQKQPDPPPPNGQSGYEPSQPQANSTEPSGASHVHSYSADSGYFSNQMPPTPAPHEIPNAPYIHGHSLPPTETPTPNYGPPGSDQLQRAGQFNNTLQVFYPPQAQSEPGSEYDVASQLRNDQYFAQSYEQYRNSPFTSQQQYYQDSSDSDSPIPPTPFYPHSGRHYHRHQQPQQLYQHDQLHPHRQQGQQHENQQQQQRTLGEYRTEQWTKEQLQRSGTHQGQDSPYQEQRRRDSYGQQQRPGGIITSLRQDNRTRTRHRQSGSRGDSPILSGEHTPTQGTYGGSHPRQQEGQRGYESPRTHRRNHPSQGQHHVHFRPDPVQREYHPFEQRQNEEQQHQFQHHPLLPPPRPSSPPKLNWNPAVEPPPKESPPISAFPEDTYFPNVWDQSPSLAHDITHQSFPSPDGADVFFNPPPPSTIPEQLIREGQYSNVLGHIEQTGQQEGVLSSPVPDKTKVHAIFPWEEKPRHVPRRVFPRSDAPAPGANYIESERTSSPISTPPAPPPLRVHAESTSQPSLSPVQGIPWGTTFSNAWDTVPSIQKYASKLAGSPRIFPYLFMTTPPPPSDDSWKRQWREQRDKDWQDQQDASSMDGDDEDDGESDEDRQSEQGRGGGGSSKRRGSSSKSKKQYRTRGVQASPETDAKGVQVEIIKDDGSVKRVSVAVGNDTALAELTAAPGLSTPAAPPADLAPPTVEAPVSKTRRQWQDDTPDAPGSALLPSAVPRDFSKETEQIVGAPTLNTSVRSGMPFPSMASPTGLRSPAAIGSPRTYSPPRLASPGGTHSPVKVRSPLASPPIQAVAPVRLSPQVQTSSQSPRGSISLQQSSPPRIGLSKSVGSPRPSGTPRRVSLSSLPSSSRAHSPVTATISRLQPSHATPSPKHLRMVTSSVQRTISSDAYVTPSPSTTNDSIVTPGDTPIEARQRRGSRVWDPARGVDVFKRSSEEVLAKFLRMGSFDGDEKQSQQDAQA